ncbi:MAG: hypothetical protein A2297_03155 [Elusimicrobia bacterium RIFOXYB2_FULL_48_7]|nr:MAG: hypothetical protein A2297_03155 [Elusimicrobia bacterium RIFOXYB2_FULL_48_7]
MKQKNDIAGLLNDVKLFSGFSRKDLQKFSKIAKIKYYEKGRRVFSQNTPGDSLYVIISGSLKIFGQTRHRKKIFAYLGPKEFFGELALFGERKRSASAETTADSTLIVIHKKDFMSVLKKNPDICLNLLSVIASRLRLADKEIELVSFQDVFGRIIRILLNLSKKYGRKTSDGKKICLSLDHKEIAELAGTVREMAARACSRLKKLNYISYYGKNIVIKDENKLKSLLQD